MFNNYHFLNDYLPERSEMLFAAHSQFSLKRLLLTNIIMWIINFLNTTKGPHSANSFEAARSRVWPCLPRETEKPGPLSAHSLGTTSSRMWHCLPCRTDKLGSGGRVSSPFLPWLSLGLVGEQETGRWHGSSFRIWFALDLWVCLYIAPLNNLAIIVLWVLPSCCFRLV